MSSLSTNLFSELSSKFFGVLTGPNARIYIDVMDLIERELPARGDSLERAEVLELIDRVLAQGIAFHADEEEEVHEDETHPAGRILKRLITANWLEEERRSDYRREIFVESSAQALLEAFRQIVSQNVASFTGKLRLVCDKLATLIYPHSRTDLIWEELKDCLSQVRTGLRELRLIRKQVERYAQRQLKTVTVSDALKIIYDEFSRLITQQCYRELIHARLPERLREAMQGLTALEQDEIALQKLRDDCLRNVNDPGQAMTEVLRTIEELSLLLGDVEPTADRVDSSTADFARRSRSRIRYIQDIGSSRRQQIKVIFDYVRENLGTLRISDLEENLTLPPLLLSDAGLIGISSLARSRRHVPASARKPVAAPLTDDEKETSLREMEKNLRNALRLDRANKFVTRLDLEPGEVITSKDMPITTEDDLLDVVSCLVFASSSGANYRLITKREQDPGTPLVHDLKAGFEIERFEVKKK
jgi:hypothetical protein